MPAVVADMLLFQTAALAALLLCGLLVQRAFSQDYLRWWNIGWVTYLAHTLAFNQGAVPLTASLLLIGAQVMQAAGAGMAVGQAAPFVWLLPLGVASFLAEMAARAVRPDLSGWALEAGYFLAAVIAAGWCVRHGRRSGGAGPWLLAFGLLLRTVHLPDVVSGGGLLPLLPETATALLAMVAMLVLALESARSHLRWSAAPGLIASVAADCLKPAGGVRQAAETISQELRRVFESASCRVHLPTPQDETEREAEMLLSVLPQSPAGAPFCITVLEPEKGAEVEAWLRANGVRWAVVVPVPFSGLSGIPETGFFALGYTRRRWLSAEAMDALVITGRQLGIVLENRRLFLELAHAYREWLNTVDAIGDLILVHGADFHIQRANRALADRVGLPPDRLVGRLCRDVLPRSAAASWTDCPFCEQPHDGDSFDEDLGGYFLVSTTHPREERSTVLHVVKDITDRKRTEERYRTMFERLHEGVFISEPAGRFLHVNDAMARMLGYERTELLGVSTPSLYSNAEEREAYLAEMSFRGWVRDYEVRLKRKNGELMVGLETSFAIRDEAGNLVQLQGFLLDITARKQAEQQLQQHVETLSASNQLAARLTGSLDTQELLRILAGEMRGIFPFDFVAGYLVDGATQMVRCVAAEGPEPGSAELLAGNLAEWEAMAGASSAGANAPGATAASPNAASATAASANAASDDAPTARPAGAHGPAPGSGASAGFFAALAADRRAIVPAGDLPPLPASEQWRGGSVYLLPLRDERDQQLIGAILAGWRSQRALSASEENLLSAIARQLNSALENAALYQQTRHAYEELRRTQQQLLQSEKMAALGLLVSGVAHELNNPLTAVIGYSQLLGSHVAPGKGEEYLGKLLHQAQRTQKIIQNLLSFSRQSKPERRLIDLNVVLEEALLLREWDLRARHVRLEKHLAALPTVQGDPHQLEQVFLNIINNALDALQDTAAGGSLVVRTFQDHPYVVAEFVDNGPGMAEPGRVFDPFYTTKSVGKGTGLGLSICYGIVKEHSGEIVAGNNVGAGATFRVRLPAIRSTVAAAQ